MSSLFRTQCKNSFVGLVIHSHQNYLLPRPSLPVFVPLVHLLVKTLHQNPSVTETGPNKSFPPFCVYDIYEIVLKTY